MHVDFLAKTDPQFTEWLGARCVPGQTIREMWGSDTPINAWINGVACSQFVIEHARIRGGQEVTAVVSPEASIAIAVGAAIAAAGAATASAAAATAAFLGISTGTLVATGLSIGLSVVGTLIQSTPSLNQGTASGGFDRLNAITGSQNKVAAYEPLPRLLGRMRYYPPIPQTARQYTETAGDDQFLRLYLVLNVGGPIDIGGRHVGPGYAKITQDTALTDVLDQAPIKLEDTDIHEYDGLDFEIGTPDQMTLYTDQIIENTPGWTTESDASGYGKHDNPTISDGDTTTRTTDVDADEISIDLSGQLYCVDTKGDFAKIRVNYQIEWRLTGSSDAWASDTFTLHDNHGKTTRKTYRITDIEQGQYDVRLTRISTYFSNLEGPPSSSVTWNALRTIRHKQPFALDDSVVMAARIKATDQLKGTISQLSVLATSVLDVYDGSAWNKQTTRTHAWAFATVWTDSANLNPLDHDHLNADALLAWAAETEAAGRYYDNVLDNNKTTLDRIKEISVAGRAAWNIEGDTRISVVRDTVQDDPAMVISPRNSSNYSYTLSVFDPPHAFRVRYIDTDSWKTTDRVVYDDGYDKSNATKFETIDAPGCTDPDQAHKHGRYELAKRRLIDIESHEFDQDVQHYVYNRGDRLDLANDTIVVSLGSGRVKSVEKNSSGNVTSLVADTFFQMAAATYGIKVTRSVGNEISVKTFYVQTDAPGSDTLTLQSPAEPLQNAKGDIIRDGIKPGDEITFGEADKITTPVKVATVTTKPNHKAHIVCQPYDPRVLDAETGPIPDPIIDVTIPPDPAHAAPAQPSYIDIISDSSVATKNDDGSLNWRIAVFVAARSSRVHTDHIEVQLKGVDDLTYDTRTATDGVAYFTGYNPGDGVMPRIRSVGDNGKPSAWLPYGEYTVTGRKPLPPTGVIVERGTLTLTLTPQGGSPSSSYEYWISPTDLANANVRAQATRAGQGHTLTIADLQPATTYYIWVDQVNAYAYSDFYKVVATTRDDASALLKAVNNRLDKTALTDALRSDIELITAPESVANSVNARLSDEQAQRIQAIQDTYSDFQQGDTATLSSAKTYADTDSQAAQRVDALVANFGGSAASALSYTISQADDQLAITRQFNEINAQLGNDGTTTSFATVQDLADAQADDEAARATLKQVLQTDYNGKLDDKADVTLVNTKASVEQLSAAQSDNESARAGLKTTLQADYNGKLSNKAAITYVDNAISDEQSARVQQYNGINASLNDKAGVNASGQILENNEVAISADHGPFANATKQVSVSDGDQTATVEEQFTAQRTDIGGLQSQWHVKVNGFTADGTPLAGGLALGTTVDSTLFAVNADEIAFGKVGQSGVDYPFYFDSSAGLAILKEANIGSLTFTKLQDSSGNFIVGSDGRIQGSYLNIDNLQVNYSAVFGPKPPVDADNTSNNISKDTSNVAGISASEFSKNDTWVKTYSVSTADGKLLKNKNDSTLTVTSSNSVVDFVAVAVTTGTSTRTKTVAHFEYDGGDWSYEFLDAARTSSNAPEFYLLSGQPAVRLYSYDSHYDVEVTIYKGLSKLSGKPRADWRNDVSGAGKPSDYADQTGSNTANDVKTGGGRAVAQSGADKTSSNTSADTSTVNGTPSNDVIGRLNYARDRIVEWRRPNTTKINGNQIYTGDAYVDTLQIKGRAVTLPLTKYIANGLYTSDFVSNEYRDACLALTLSNPKNATAQIQVSGLYRARGNSSSSLVIRISRKNGSGSFKNLYESEIDYKDNGSIHGSLFIRVQDNGLIAGTSALYHVDVKFKTFGGDEVRELPEASISFIGFWK